MDPSSSRLVSFNQKITVRREIESDDNETFILKMRNGRHRKTTVAMSPSVTDLLTAQRMLDIEEPLVKNKKYPFFKTPRLGGSRRIRNRLVQKQGLCNISLKNVPKQRRKYFSDIFTTVIEMKWRWCLLYFSLSFMISWSFFATVYYLIAKQHGDIEQIANATWTPCIVNVHNELNAFLFSFTTQTTIGYGFRYPTDACPLTIVTMCFQFMWGVMTQTLMAGIIFSKLARPIKRAATLIFSKNAVRNSRRSIIRILYLQVICLRDGKLCLLFRVGDMRKSSLAEAHVRLQFSPNRLFFPLSFFIGWYFCCMIKRCVTYEGELLPFHQFDMDVGYDQGLDRVFVIWPITICHEIDERSPLWEIGAEDLKSAKFEIIAILEGVVESVGSTTQARTSYLPSEILWGHRVARFHLDKNTQQNIHKNKHIYSKTQTVTKSFSHTNVIVCNCKSVIYIISGSKNWCITKKKTDNTTLILGNSIMLLYPFSVTDHQLYSSPSSANLLRPLTLRIFSFFVVFFVFRLLSSMLQQLFIISF
ncbi:Protein CBR-IRK-2 [Caenorhabditis briggsae]|uniref:Protein CBR-IRK-2 n=1 Tax=Caenorhabditis briggsae TaxID=6238 RepID=A8X5V6_CAEBR|nr:Protein CBR-IRK-2 [Caenorhabditis briggsae]CAP28017.2 Protein CBR-IRK-2 [Caenorhabditis briggsae]